MMSKYMGVIIGAIIVLLGIKGIWCWWGDFLAVLRGSIPAMFILLGAIAVIAGISEIRDEAASKKSR